MREWIDAVNALPLAGLMFVVALGYSLGRVSYRGVSPGPAGGTLVVALLLGHFGLEPGPVAGLGVTGFSLGTFGFALFIYSVGFDAAPHVFSSFHDRRGWRFVGVAVLVNGLALALAVASARLFALDPSSAAGLLAGALTSAPTYAAASEVVTDTARLSVAFVITYPFGLLGVVFLIQLVPRLLHVDLAQGAASEDEVVDSLQLSGKRPSGPSPEVTRAFEVRTEAVVGRCLCELDLVRRTGCVISRLQQGDELVMPDADSVLALGDHVMATGRIDELREFESLVGPEVDTGTLRAEQLPARRVQVRRGEVVGRSLAELRMMSRFHCVVTRVERGSLWIEPDAEVTLARNDVLEVVGHRADIRALARELGHFEPSMSETDIAVYAGGIVLGILLGAVHLRPFGLDLSLGLAGGLLVTGFVLGVQPHLGPLRTHVPREARQLVRDLGILLFMSETGLLAGARLLEGLASSPWQIFAAGLVVNVASVAGTLFVARRLLGLRPLDAWGSICGGLTSSAAFQAVRRVADSNEVAISYAAAYAVGSVLATLAGPLVVWLSR